MERRKVKRVFAVSVFFLSAVLLLTGCSPSESTYKKALLHLTKDVSCEIVDCEIYNIRSDDIPGVYEANAIVIVPDGSTKDDEQEIKDAARQVYYSGSKMLSFSGVIVKTESGGAVTTPKPDPMPTPTPARDMSFMDGTWRDEVYKEGNSWVQFEVIINTGAGTVSINSITENARTVMFGDMEITEYGDNYVSAGGYVFTYLDGDLLDVNSALFTNPPLTRYSDEIDNDAFGSDPNDYKKTSSSGTTFSLSDDVKGTLWALAEKAVKNELKSPSTAKFPRSYGSSDVTFGQSGDLYTISAWVEAENSFGATLRTDFTVYAYREGLTFYLDHVEFAE